MTSRGTPLRIGLLLAGLLCAPALLRGQTTPVPGTLRYGSGLLNVPVASVLPSLAVSAGYSGFSVDVPSRPLVGPDGTVVGQGDPWRRWLSDASVAVGLGGRAEVGTSLQSLRGRDRGGSMVGAFGRFLLLDPSKLDGLGLAVGARWVSAPTFSGRAGEPALRPGRLGFPDERLRASYGEGRPTVKTGFSPYVVASAFLPGFDLRFVPEHDFTLALGWGGGMFSSGHDLPWYAAASSHGWFFGSAAHVRIRRHLVWTLEGEYDGFDVNLGTALDVGGVRIGAYVLGENYPRARSAYESRKVGISASVAFCPRTGGLCGPELRPRKRARVVQLPAPPPDTILVGRTIRRSAYAEGRDWYRSGSPVELEGRSYRRAGPPRPVGGELEIAGGFDGVPVFVPAGEEAPYSAIFVPVRADLWQRYEASASSSPP